MSVSIAYVSHIYCNCFIWILRMCCNGFSSVSCVFFCKCACFKCFVYLQTYIVSVVFGCFKSKSGIACPSLLSSTVSPLPRHLLPYILLRLESRYAGGWRRGRKHTLSPFVMRAGSASVQYFCYAGMLRWMLRGPGIRS
jgi:hypothetical protein